MKEIRKCNKCGAEIIVKGNNVRVNLSFGSYLCNDCIAYLESLKD